MSNSAPRKKKRDNPIFVTVVMLFLILAAVFVTIEVVNTLNTKGQQPSRASQTLDEPTFKHYSLSQAETICLTNSRAQYQYPRALFIDSRSTKMLKPDRYRLFVQVDSVAAQGDQSMFVCDVQNNDGVFDLHYLKMIKDGEEAPNNRGMETLMKALKIQ